MASLMWSRSDFWLAIDVLRMEHGASVTGGARTPKRNAMVGGHPESKHVFVPGTDQTGLAADLVVDAGTKYAADQLAAAGRKLGWGAVVYPTEGRVHFQWPPKGKPAPTVPEDRIA